MLRSLIRLMRPGEWVKNIFVLPALAFALPTLLAADHDAGLWHEVQPLLGATAVAFVAFCLISSGFYGINDVLDVKSDRLHPIKCRRPVASGEILPGVALLFSVALIVAAFVLAASISRSLALVLAMYALVQSLYNIVLKRVMLVDVVAVAIGFALRATAGAVAIEVQISVWLIMCVFFLCVYLGFVKRLCDLSSAHSHGARQWHSVAGYDDRNELNWLLGVSAVLAIVTYLMYALSDHAWSIFGSRSIGFALLSPLVMITIHRFYRRASTGESDSPLQALRSDRTVAASVVLFVTGVLATLYVPAVQNVLDNLFIARVSVEALSPESIR
jgi:decaprenyl-phosphate phosphoribosyltransferase